MASGDIFLALRRYVKGKIDKNDLYQYDKSIDDVIENRENRAQSKIRLDFKDAERFGKIIGLSDDDIWFEQAVSSPYHPYEIWDSGSVDYEFRDGYGPWYDFDDDNKELVRKIAKLIYGKKFDVDNEKDRGDFTKFLEKTFPREVTNIVNDWTQEKNHETNQVASQHVYSEIENFLGQFGLKRRNYGIETTISDLISLYFQYDATHLSIRKLLTNLFENAPKGIGGWDEDRYEYQDSEVFDSDSFNREVNRNLENILEKIDEEYEGGDFEGYLKMTQRVTKKYNIGTWYELPKDSKLLFRIDGFDRETNKIDITIRKKGGSLVKTKFSEEGFNKLLYQPELFDLVDL